MNKKFDPGVELPIGTSIVSAVPCGVGSIILTAVEGELATIKLYDAVSGPAVAPAIKALSCGGVADKSASAVYCPAKSDSFAKGCVAVVGGTSAKGYVSIES